MGGLTNNSESWRDVPVSVLAGHYGITQFVLDRLKEESLETLGMVNWRLHTDPPMPIDGIGPVKHRLLVDAMERHQAEYQRSHPESTPCR